MLGLDLTHENGETKWRYEFEYCPVNYIQPYNRTWLGLYSLWRNGFLLDAGGIGDQPSKYIDVMQFVESLFNQHEKEQLEQMKASPTIPKTKTQVGRR